MVFRTLEAKAVGVNKDLTGLKFGRLFVLSCSYKNKNKQACWHCACICGRECDVVGVSLSNGSVVSCGCFRIEQVRKALLTHGMTRTRLYRIWHNMKQRCENSNAAEYHNYGGRGISVCREWQGFAAFSDWALASGYANHLKIDRVDNDGGYHAGNCRWATQKEQSNNMRTNRIICYEGERLTVSQWAGRIGIRSSVLSHRIAAYGVSEKMAVWYGKSMPRCAPRTEEEWVNRYGMLPSTNPYEHGINVRVRVPSRDRDETD